MKIAVIPARGGSKRIPRKNIKPFAGQPMIAHPIRAARSSGLFDHVVVSTDDDEIAAIALEYGAQVPFRRPINLAGDHTPTVPVVADAIARCQALGWSPSAVCCIYPCAPLLHAADLSAALEMLILRKADYVFPVTPFPSPIQRALRRDATSGATAPFDPRHAATRSQDLEPAYHDAAQFYWGRPLAWLAGHNIHQHGHTIVIPNWRVVDIDTPEDWERAEHIHRALA